MSDRNPKSIADLQMTTEAMTLMMRVILVVIQSRAAKPVVTLLGDPKSYFNTFCTILIKKIQRGQKEPNPIYPSGAVGCIANAQKATQFILSATEKGNFDFSGSEPVGGNCQKAIAGYVNLTGQMIWHLQLYWHALTTCHLNSLISDLSEGNQFNVQKALGDVPTLVLAGQSISRYLYPSCHAQLMTVMALMPRMREEITQEQWHAVRKGLEIMERHENAAVRRVAETGFDTLPEARR